MTFCKFCINVCKSKNLAKVSKKVMAMWQQKVRNLARRCGDGDLLTFVSDGRHHGGGPVAHGRTGHGDVAVVDWWRTSTTHGDVAAAAPAAAAFTLRGIAAAV